MTEKPNCLLLKLQEIDLALVDSGLYLDAYRDAEAWAYFNKLCKERAELAEAYQKNAVPLTKCGQRHENAWTNTPWPWEWEAN